MAYKYLFIVESPNKCKTIQKYLGDEYKVIATVGHFKDLPEKKLGIDLKNNFKATYEVQSKKEDVVNQIKTLSASAEMVYLATDLDREGEAISWFIKSVLSPKTKYKRVTYNAVTKQSILEGIKNARDIDYDMVNSFETRRLLDRICGFKCSYPTKLATGGPSAGRVQSSGLRILAELEKEIQAFIPQAYWPVEIEVQNSNKDIVKATIKSPKPLDIKTKEEADAIVKSLKSNPIKVSSYVNKNVDVKPYAPFTTSTMLQAGASQGLSSDKTTSAAQELFTQGHITYIRTDSVYIDPVFVTGVRTHISSNYPVNYLSSSVNHYATSATAQAAHEAIRPTDINVKTAGKTSDEQKLYELIWKRTVASQMSNAEYERINAEFTDGQSIFGASGSRELFDGFRKVWDYSSAADRFLPQMAVGEVLDLLSVKSEEKFTEPPNRYTEVSFIKELEDKGIGRPSTYNSIPKTLLARKYVTKKGNSLVVTDLGIRVSDFLIKCNFCFVDVNFTSDLEAKLDLIAEKKDTKIKVLTDFWNRLQVDLSNAAKFKNAVIVTEYKCPRCQGGLLRKRSIYGEFFCCDKFIKGGGGCEYTAKVGKNGEPLERIVIPYVESDILCKNCKQKLYIRKSKKGNDYLSCRNWQKKGCAGFYKMDGEKMDFSGKNRPKVGRPKKDKNENKD